MSNVFASEIAAIASTTDMTKAQTGGDYQPPAAGPCRLRFVGYVEIGKHLKKGFQGAPDKVKQMARLFFEVSGPKHPPIKNAEGTERPAAVIEVRLDISLNEKAGFKKLFDRLNYAGKAKHIAELLGEPFRGVLVHRAYKKADGTEGIACDLKDAAGWTIQAPRVEDPDTGEYRTVQVAPALTPLRLLLQAGPSKAQWASIHIPGQRDDGTSRNYLQELCLAALDYKGSALEALLGGAAEGLSGPVTKANDEEEDADAFAGI